MKKTIQELCSETGEISFPKLSEQTGLPLSTVRYFFRKPAKDPSVYIAGPICAALQISLDQYFGIVSNQEERTQQDFLRAVRDNPTASPETRLEAVKMLSVHYGREVK